MNNSPFNLLRSSNGPLLITGHTGFKGAWLTSLLKAMDIEFVGLSLPAERDSLFERGGFESGNLDIFGDIRDKDFLEQSITRLKPSAILHLAAQPLVLKSYSDPISTFEINVNGTANLLNAAIKSNSIRTVGVVTTDKVYKNDNLGRRFIETDSLEGKDPYSASKVGTESVVSAWRKISELKDGPKIFSLRAGNVVGGGDYAENRLIPDLVRARISDRELRIRSAESTRPWQHVLDPLWGYLLALEDSLANGTSENFNFGPDEKSLSVREVIEQVREHWPINIRFEEDSSFYESKFLDLDSSKAKSMLRWSPNYNQRDSIDKTLIWWDRQLAGLSASENCKIQVNEFISLKL